MLFGPLQLAHEWADLVKRAAVLWTVVVFCCAASATYMLNDVLDVEADRSHPRKQRRPFASGEISLAWGPVASVGPFAMASGIVL